MNYIRESHYCEELWLTNCRTEPELSQKLLKCKVCLVLSISHSFWCRSNAKNTFKHITRISGFFKENNLCLTFGNFSFAFDSQCALRDKFWNLYNHGSFVRKLSLVRKYRFYNWLERNGSIFILEKISCLAMSLCKPLKNVYNINERIDWDSLKASKSVRKTHVSIWNPIFHYLEHHNL